MAVVMTVLPVVLIIVLAVDDSLENAGRHLTKRGEVGKGEKKRERRRARRRRQVFKISWDIVEALPSPLSNR